MGQKCTFENADVKFNLEAPEREEIKPVAADRRATAIDFYEGQYPREGTYWSDRNPLGNHIYGELGERVVHRWLESEGIIVARPATFLEELQTAGPDLKCALHGMEVDVKTLGVWGDLECPTSQPGKGRIVVWCRCSRPEGHTGFASHDKVVPDKAWICGWSTDEEVMKAPYDRTKQYRVVAEPRPLRDLLAHLRTGHPPPPHPALPSPVPEEAAGEQPMTEASGKDAN